jgi:hypothetical protein
MVSVRVARPPYAVYMPNISLESLRVRMWAAIVQRRLGPFGEMYAVRLVPVLLRCLALPNACDQIFFESIIVQHPKAASLFVALLLVTHSPPPSHS